jgi:hypothetical protein
MLPSSGKEWWHGAWNASAAKQVRCCVIVLIFRYFDRPLYMLLAVHD